MTDTKPYRMWYVPQAPMNAFIRQFDTEAEARAALDLVSSFSAFEFTNLVKPDYADAGGVEAWDADEGEWDGEDGLWASEFYG